MPEKKITFRCIPIEQPIGTFYIGSLPCQDLCEITFSDVRRIEGERGFETYLGIQRPLLKHRVAELRAYVQSPDACFPTAVILAVDSRCAEYDVARGEMTFTEVKEGDGRGEPIEFKQMAKVIDGQHRIEGLRELKNARFDVNVSIFIDMDVSDQAYLFSTVNLAQTKVNKSLVYDLFDLAKTRSPQRTCHEMAVALDKHEKSPFFERIKRLGRATPGRFGETITQATFVEGLIGYLSQNPLGDRNLFLSRKQPPLASAEQLKITPFRNMFLKEKDLQITDVVWNYFDAVKKRWPEAWNSQGRGIMLNKTNGFRGFMRFLRPAYLHLCGPGEVPEVEKFSRVFSRIRLTDDDFTTERFVPGTGGEATLLRTLSELSRIPA